MKETSQLTSPPQDEPQPNNLIAIASGKGGVGKTWLSITLAQLFARSGRHVLLFDGDLGLANVDVQLGLTPQKDLATVLAGKATLQESILSYDTGEFDIIAGRSGSASLASLPISRLENVYKELIRIGKNYDAVLLDLGAGVEQHVRYLSSLASRCLVVVTDDPTSLTDAYAFIKLCKHHEHSPDISIVINQVTTVQEGERTYSALKRACENFLGVSPKLAGIIRKDNKVKDAIRNQKPLLEKSPKSMAASDAAALSVKLMMK